MGMNEARGIHTYVALIVCVISLPVVLCVDRCLEECTLIDTTLECKIQETAVNEWERCECVSGCLSSVNVPSNVTTVDIISFAQAHFDIKPGSFQGDWKLVTTLKIETPQSYVIIFPYAFMHLQSLRHLYILSGNLGICASYTSYNNMFGGLDNLSHLELIGNIECYASMIYDLGQADVLRKLKTIILQRVPYWSTILPTRSEKYGKEFFQSMANGRNLTSLSLYYFYVEDLDLFLENELSFNIRDILISNCTVNNMFLDYTTTVRFVRTISFKHSVIRNWNFNKIMERVVLPSLNVRTALLIERYKLTPCPKYNLLDVKKLLTCHSFLSCLEHGNANCSLRLYTVPRDHTVVRIVARGFIRYQEKIDLSSMTITYIEPDILPEVARVISLSENNLGDMQRKKRTDFGRLFKAMYLLQSLNLDKNNLLDLPYHMFANTARLSTLRLSGNRLKTFKINTKHLKHLQLLDLSYNNIKVIDSKTQFVFDQLAVRKEKVLKVDLSGNPFICGCKESYLQSMKWMTSSEFLVSDGRQYSCDLDARSYNIYGSAISATEEYCQQEDRNKLITLVVPPISIVVIVSMLVLLLVKRRTDRKRKLNAILNQIQNEEFPWRYVVFLSFCSEDEDLVMDIIYPQLTDTIAELTKRDFDLICVGDKHFLPGHPLCSQIISCIEESAVMLSIVSKQYCQKNWCQTEIREAYHLRKPIIMLTIDYVDTDQMGEFLGKIFQRYAHASWIPDDDVGHLEPDWPIFGKAIFELATTSTVEEENEIIDDESVM